MENHVNIIAFKFIKFYIFNTYIITAVILLTQTNGFYFDSNYYTGCVVKEHPYMVYVDLGGKKHCSASLLNMGWILTTAVCVSSRPRYAYAGYNSKILLEAFSDYDDDFVQMQASPLFTGQRTTLRRYYKHPKYDGFQYNVAIAQLRYQFKPTPEVAPIIIAPPDMETYKKAIVDVIGFTVNMGGFKEIGCVCLKKIKNSVCKLILSQDKNITLAAKNHFCILPKGRLSEIGPTAKDKGTPILIAHLQVAIMTDIFDIGNKNYLSVYVWTDEFYYWITNHTTIRTDALSVFTNRRTRPRFRSSSASWFSNSLLLLPFCMSFHLNLLLSVFV